MNGEGIPLHRAVLRAVPNFQRDGGLMMAAAVAFYVLLSLAPLVYLIAIVLSRVFLEADATATILDASGSLVPEEALPGFRRILGNIRLDGKVALIAVPGLLWVSTTAFHVFEVAVNLAFGVGQSPRRIWRARLIGLGTLVVGSVILGIATVATTFLPRLSETLRNSIGLPAVASVLEHGSRWMAHLLTFLAFVALYRLLPAVKVRWQAAVQGALVALLLWAGLTQLFGIVIGRSPAAGLVNGAMAGSIGFLLWIYFAVALSIFGAEVTALVNASRSKPREAAPSRPPGARSAGPS